VSQASTNNQHLHGIRAFRLVTPDLPRLTGFYRDVLGFVAEGDVQPISAEELHSLGVQGGGWRQILSIGRQTVAIDRFEIGGRSYPAGSDAASLWFQHLALVVVDIAEAHGRLRDMAPISIGGPQQKPQGNRGPRLRANDVAATRIVWHGTTAGLLSDPDGHLQQIEV